MRKSLMPRFCRIENARLKKLLADAHAGHAVLKDIAANEWRTRGTEERCHRCARGTGSAGGGRARSSTRARYRSTRPDDVATRSRLRALAAERRRFGYRRLGSYRPCEFKNFVR